MEPVEVQEHDQFTEQETVPYVSERTEYEVIIDLLSNINDRLEFVENVVKEITGAFEGMKANPLMAKMLGLPRG